VGEDPLEAAPGASSLGLGAGNSRKTMHNGPKPAKIAS